MKAKELKAIIEELGEDGKEIIANKLDITIRMVDYWLSGSVKIREINAIAIRSIIEHFRKESAKIRVPIKN